MRIILLLIIFFLSKNAFPLNEVVFIWSGAITPTSAKINARISDPSEKVRLIYDVNREFRNPDSSNYVRVTGSTNLVFSIIIGGLRPSTHYYYAIEVDGKTDFSEEDIGSFKTFDNKPFSFDFIAGACAGNSNHPVYKVMKEFNPLFYLNMGDLHYADPNSTDLMVHRRPYEELVLGQPAAKNFFQEIPIAYVWDDHDFSGDGSNVYNTGRNSAARAYREYVPHYPLAVGSNNTPIYQSFLVGRIRFILSDLRSERTFENIMSEKQMTWLKNEFLKAKRNKEIICWVSSVSWSGNQDDNWGGYRKNRAEIANFLRDSDIKNMFILCGDAHMLAIDNGDHTDFSTSGKANKNEYPLMQAAALNRSGSFKGGIYSHGSYPNPDKTFGQFGLIKISDNGSDNICIEFEGYRVNSEGNFGKLLDHRFCRNINKTLFFKIFPNPARKTFFLEIENAEINRRSIVNLYDLQGRKVFEKVIEINHGRNLFEFQVGNIQPGIYIFSFEFNQVTYTSRLIIAVH